MKKRQLALAFLVGFGMLVHQNIQACSSFLISKGASADGSTMITYAADSHTLYGELYQWPAMDHPEGAMLDIYEWDTGKFLGKIKQIAHTYSVIGNMNEHQVAISESTYGGRSELRDTTGIMDYGSLIYVALQRSKTAREAIKVITSLVKEYGYYSSGESFSIGDPNEAWIMEFISKGPDNKGAVWVARRLPDGYISAHANQARITTFPLNDKANCLYASDVISFAREKGYFSGKNKEFSFSDAYAPLDFGAIRFCDARVWSFFNLAAKGMDKYIPYVEGKSKKRIPLWIKPDKPVTVQNCMNWMRDHYEGTPLDMTQDVGAGPFKVPYRWRPLTWKVGDKEYFNERAIATQQTGFSFVAQCRSGMPDAIGGIFWFGVDDAASTVYMPMYCGIREIPESLKHGNGGMLEHSWSSAFWVFNWVSNMAYTKYSFMMEDIKKVQQDLENKFVAFQPGVDQAALTLHKKDPELARQFLTEYSISQAQMTTKRWKELGQFLMVKYIDGNVKRERNGKFIENGSGMAVHPDQPGYSKDFYDNVVKKTGDRLKMREVQE